MPPPKGLIARNVTELGAVVLLLAVWASWMQAEELRKRNPLRKEDTQIIGTAVRLRRDMSHRRLKPLAILNR
jgi:hypothetical protein